MKYEDIPKKTITIDVTEAVYGLLEVLTKGDFGPENVEGVVLKLIDHAQQGVYRPGAWERDWIRQAFGYDWERNLECGDPYGRPDSGALFHRPLTSKTRNVPEGDVMCLDCRTKWKASPEHWKCPECGAFRWIRDRSSPPPRS